MKKLIINTNIDVLDEIKVVRYLYEDCDFIKAKVRIDTLIENIEKSKEK